MELEIDEIIDLRPNNRMACPIRSPSPSSRIGSENRGRSFRVESWRHSSCDAVALHRSDNGDN